MYKYIIMLALVTLISSVTYATEISNRADSAFSFSDAAQWCVELEQPCAYSVDGTACATGSTLYSDWHMPDFDSIVKFTRIVDGSSTLWTRTRVDGPQGSEANARHYIAIIPGTGAWSEANVGASIWVRCTRP